VISHAPATADIAVIDLAAADDGEFPSYTAGARIDAGSSEAWSASTRCADRPGNGQYRLAVPREPMSRGGSLAMHALKVGDRLRISMPHYCARSRSCAAFVPELARSPRVVFHFDDEDSEQVLDVARDLGEPQHGTAVYVCGPAGFIDYVLGKARALGWPPEALH
jgi:vanillate O-demethylase ferredoxin subunit